MLKKTEKWRISREEQADGEFQILVGSCGAVEIRNAEPCMRTWSFSFLISCQFLNEIGGKRERILCRI